MKLLLAPMEGLADDVCGKCSHVLAATIGPSPSSHASPEPVFHRAFGGVSAPSCCAGRDRRRYPGEGSAAWLGPADDGRKCGPAGRSQAPGVDLNFGCPAPIVNRHRGGAVLLNEPELLFRISAAVRGHCRTAFPSAPRCGSAWMTRDGARVRTGPGRRWRRVAGGACAYQGGRLPSARPLGMGGAHRRDGADSGGCQW